jgi:hypothetical protein
MQKQKSGHIINMASVFGIKVFAPDATVYCATKAAVRALTEGLRMELNSQISAARRRRSDRTDRCGGSYVREDCEECHSKGISRCSTRDAHHQHRPDQCRPARVHQAKQTSGSISPVAFRVAYTSRKADITMMGEEVNVRHYDI